MPLDLLKHDFAETLGGGPTLDPHTITKYANHLAVLPAMPSSGTVEHGSVDNYVIPLVTHLHGAHSFEESDGYPEAWFLPWARNIPDGYATVGSFYDRYAEEFGDRIGPRWFPGSSVYQYNNDQRATALWFHDHALGMTRVNIQMGLSGLYLVRGGDSDDISVPPDRPQLPALTPLGTPSHTRRLSLNELASATFADAPIAGLLGTFNADGTPRPMRWMDPVSETPAVNVPETWELVNFTDDAHPIHVHQIQFQVVNREPTGSGNVRGPDAGEEGFKDTVLAYPGETTRIRMSFDLPGRYVWHCHIIDHEDNEMMRPLQVEQ